MDRGTRMKVHVSLRHHLSFILQDWFLPRTAQARALSPRTEPRENKKTYGSFYRNPLAITACSLSFGQCWLFRWPGQQWWWVKLLCGHSRSNHTNRFLSLDKAEAMFGKQKPGCYARENQGSPKSDVVVSDLGYLDWRTDRSQQKWRWGQDLG